MIVVLAAVIEDREPGDGDLEVGAELLGDALGVVIFDTDIVPDMVRGIVLELVVLLPVVLIIGAKRGLGEEDLDRGELLSESCGVVLPDTLGLSGSTAERRVVEDTLLGVLQPETDKLPDRVRAVELPDNGLTPGKLGMAGNLPLLLLPVLVGGTRAVSAVAIVTNNSSCVLLCTKHAQIFASDSFNGRFLDTRSSIAYQW